MQSQISRERDQKEQAALVDTYLISPGRQETTLVVTNYSRRTVSRYGANIEGTIISLPSLPSCTRTEVQIHKLKGMSIDVRNIDSAFFYHIFADWEGRAWVFSPLKGLEAISHHQYFAFSDGLAGNLRMADKVEALAKRSQIPDC